MPYDRKVALPSFGRMAWPQAQTNAHGTNADTENVLMERNLVTRTKVSKLDGDRKGYVWKL